MQYRTEDLSVNKPLSWRFLRPNLIVYLSLTESASEIKRTPHYWSRFSKEF
jgi:hypothetical protein